MGLVSQLNTKDLVNPIFLFSMYWFFILFMAFLGLKGFNVANDYTLLVYFSGILSFGIGGILLDKRYIKISNSGSDERKETSLNTKMFYTICILVLGYSFIKFMRVLPFIQQGLSFGDIRSLYWSLGSGITTNALDYFIDNTINKGLQLVIFTVASAEIASKNKSRLLIFFLIAIALLTASISGGRLVFFDVLIIIFMSFFIFKRKIQISSKTKKLITTVVVCSIICMVYLTNQRQGSEGFLLALYGNFTLNVPLMNHVILAVKESGDITYGLTFLKGFIEPVFAVLNALNIANIPESISTLSKYIVPFFDIGGNNVANAYTSAFFYFYLDGRIIGVIIGSTLYGIICMHFYNRMKKNFNPQDVALYLLVIDTIFRSMISFSFSVSSYVLALIIIPLMYRKIKIIF